MSVDINLINNIKKELLDNIQKTGLLLLSASTDSIYKVLNCTECSLWSINSNETKIDGDSRPEKSLSTSLIHRKVSKTIDYRFIHEEDFVHSLKPSFFEKGIEKSKKEGSYYFRCNQADAISNYRSKDFIVTNNINDFIVIPIPKKDNVDEIVAIIEISYMIPNGYSVDTWNDLSLIIREFLSVAFYRNVGFQKQSLIELLIEEHDRFRDLSVETLFDNMLNVIIKNFCLCQGASLFIWNSYGNSFNLVSTTGITNAPASLSEVSYKIGEGLTGKIGKYHVPYITDDIKKEEHCEHKGKWKEELQESAKTAMFIPICRPSDECDVIGIVRFVNKKNYCNNDIVDYFNDNDVDVIMFISKYLSFVIDYYIKEVEQNDFVARLSHETMSPANAIRKTADRIYKNYQNKDFQKDYLLQYIQDIIDFSELQKWQATTNMYLWRRYWVRSSKKGYNIKQCSLYEILKDSKELVAPIAKDNNVNAENIDIDGSIINTILLKVDRDAFVTLFYNLFTNAIKYHDRSDLDRFYIRVSCFTDKNISICIEDNGIGINAKEKDEIFKIGYRGENAIRVSASGMGVGMPVIKQIVEDFEGTINITSYHNPTIIKIDLPGKLLSYEKK